MIIEKFSNYRTRNGTVATIKKVFSRLLEKIGFKQLAAYEQVQWEFENKICNYLKISADEISSFYIIGAHKAAELPSLRKRYAKAEFELFEPYPKYSKYLNHKFGDLNRVRVHALAVSDQSGKIDFYQTNIDGSGSLYKPNKTAEQNYNMRVTEEVVVPVTTLDKYCQSELKSLPDILWIDVQGQEYSVLKGASGILSQTRAIFVEVAAMSPIYENQVCLNKITQLLEALGFSLVGLGTDPLNFTGNAIFIRRP